MDVERLNALNDVEELMIATRHTNTAVRRGDKLAGTRIIPLVIQEEILRAAEERAGKEPLLSLTPWKLKTCGLITTGSEVAKGLIQDAFTPVIVDKLAACGITVTEHCLPGDDRAAITAAALDFHAKGVDLVLCTGGMSVDPDDRTPGAIKDTGRRLSPTARRCCPGPCSCWPTSPTAPPSWACPAALCTPRPPFLTWCSPASPPGCPSPAGS